jgi:hypothetical protein
MPAPVTTPTPFDVMYLFYSTILRIETSIDQILLLLQNNSTLLQTLGKNMATISDDITALLAATSAITTDVATVLADLAAANNITPAQQQSLEAQITALQQADASIQAAINPPTPPVPPSP